MRFSDFEGRPNQNTNHQVATISNTAKTLAGAGVTLHADTHMVRVVAESADVRLVLNGATAPDPATSFGELLYDGDAILLSRRQADVAQFIRNAATDAKLQVAQFAS